MRNYRTTEETAAEWGVTPGHVQYLCRKGTIAGAIKRSRVWFIPDDAPIPIKYTKSSANNFHFVGTKKKIFDSAIELFTMLGFSNVSLRDIAEKVGISQSAIYGHFKSKQEILNTAYDAYCRHYRESRPTLDSLEPLLQNGSLLDIIKLSHYKFKEEYLQEMLYITNIIFQRIPIDEQAREIGRSLVLDEGIQFVESIFERAMETGRVAPHDAHAIAVLINSTRIYTLLRWMIDPSPEGMTQPLTDEHTLYQHIEKLLMDLRPPETETRSEGPIPNARSK